MGAIQWKTAAPEEFWQQKFRTGLLAMMTEVDREAKINAPVKTGALKNSGRFYEQAGDVIEQFGNNRVQYAAKRERGPNRDSSTEHYLERAARDVSSGNIARFFQ